MFSLAPKADVLATIRPIRSASCSGAYGVSARTTAFWVYQNVARVLMATGV